MKKLFTREDAWTGGYYELGFKLSQAPEANIRKALAVLWSYPGFDGCYLRGDLEPNEQERVSPMDIPTEDNNYGLCNLPNGNICPCRIYASKYRGTNFWWVYLLIPRGSLDMEGYPISEKRDPYEESWFQSMDMWLRAIAEYAFKTVKFDFSVIGIETETMNLDEALSSIKEGNKWEGFLIPEDDKLKWYPPS